MALPLTNLTFHSDASVNTDVWENFQAGTPFHNTPATDGIRPSVWDDVEHGAFSWIYTSFNNRPFYRTVTPLMLLPCIEFIPAQISQYKLWSNAGNPARPMSDIFAVGAKTVLFSIYVAAIATNAANVWDNSALLSDTGSQFGIHFRDNGSATADANGVSSQYKIIAYNWDGNADSVELSIALSTSYVGVIRHDGTNLYLSLNGGAEVSVASGNTSDLSAVVKLGVSTNNSYYSGRVGEIAFYNAALTGTDLSDATTYFTSKWAPSAVAAVAAFKSYLAFWMGGVRAPLIVTPAGVFPRRIPPDLHGQLQSLNGNFQ